ncbi:MAG: hypothetical protein ACFFB3_19995 [Candidatus Hodarchaeota archaeon]
MRFIGERFKFPTKPTIRADFLAKTVKFSKPEGS